MASLRGELRGSRVEVIAIDDAQVGAQVGATTSRNVPPSAHSAFVQAVLGYAGIAEADLGREHGRQRALDRLEGARRARSGAGGGLFIGAEVDASHAPDADLRSLEQRPDDPADEVPADER